MGDISTQTSQPKYEEVQFFFRKHWTHFLKPIIFGMLIGLLALFFFLILGALLTFFRITVLYPLFAFLVIIFAILFIDIFFLQIINYYFNVIIITDCRIVIARKTVFLKNDNDAIDLTKIQDIAVIAHGLFRNYLNYGALVITLSTSAPQVVMPFVPNPHYYLEQMNRVKREHILRRQERKGTEDKVPKITTEDYLQDVDKLEYAT